VNPVHVLIFGKNGQVGSQLVDQLVSRPEYRVTATDIEQVDLANDQATRQLVLDHSPDRVINASAYTAVDHAESEESLCMQLNATAPHVIATACEQIGAAMVHYSTDYVFDGSSTMPYLETDHPNPQSVYGKTKLAGEKNVVAALKRAIVLRTARVYSKDGNNFVNTMLRLADERDGINVVDDQYGSPTLAHDLAAATIPVVDQLSTDSDLTRFGVYHVTANGVTNWYGFSREIMRLSVNQRVSIHPIPDSQCPTPAPRPNYSVPSNKKLAKQFDVALPDWQDGLSRCLGE